MSETAHGSNSAPRRPLKVLSIWHGAVRALNRERYDALAQTENLDLTVLAPRRWSAAMPRELEFEPGDTPGYRMLVEPAWFRGHAVTHVYPRLFSILSSTRPDLIDLYEEPYTLIAWLVAWWRNQFAPGCKLVFTACQNITKKYPPPFRWMERYVLESADAAMGLSHLTLEMLLKKGYKGPFEGMPTGIDPQRFRRVEAGELRRQLGLDRPTVGYLGRLVEEKGIATLLEAAARSANDFQILIVGDGPEEKALRQQADDLGIADRVVWVGSVGSDDVARYLSCMDVFVLPSRTRLGWKEQLGRVLIEAMACEVAVIGSLSGAIPRVIHDVGLLYHEALPDKLQEAIDRLLDNDDLRHELAAKGRQRAEIGYAWSAIANDTREVWQQALERPPLEVRRRR